MTDSRPQTQTPKAPSRLDLPVGQVVVTLEAIKALADAGVSIDEVLAEHARGYGGDFDFEETFENHKEAAAGGDNFSQHDIAEDVAIRVHTPWHHHVTIVWLYTEAE